jgi:hypothetical protein
MAREKVPSDNTLRDTDDLKQKARQKENNPFSEEDKHGPGSHRRSPGDAQEYQNDPSVQRRSPGVEEEDDTASDQQEIA